MHEYTSHGDPMQKETTLSIRYRKELPEDLIGQYF